MTYEEFSKKQKQILEECRPLIKDLRLEEFNAKMNELIELQDKYLEERKAEKQGIFKGVQLT